MPWGSAARCSAPWAGGRRPWRRSAALQIDSALGSVRLELAEVLRALGKDLEAVAEFDRCLASDSSTSAEARLRLGGLLCELDYVEEAVEDLGPLREDEGLSPRLHAVALATRGQALSAMGRYEGADDLLRRAIALEGGIKWFHGLRGWVLENLGRGEEALVSYQKALEKPATEDNHWYRKAVGNALFHPWCRKGMANALYLQGQLEEASRSTASDRDGHVTHAEPGRGYLLSPGLVPLSARRVRQGPP